MGRICWKFNSMHDAGWKLGEKKASLSEWLMPPQNITGIADAVPGHGLFRGQMIEVLLYQNHCHKKWELMYFVPGARKPNKQRQPLIQNQRQPLSIQIQRQRQSQVECSPNDCWGSSRCRRARPACQPAQRRCEKKNQGRSSTGQAGWGGIIC